MQFLPVVILSTICIAVGLGQQSQTAPTASPQSAERIGERTTLNATEAQFVQDAIESGKQEIQLGQLALRQSSTDAIKEYAQRLINDHQSANQKLEQIAKSNRVVDNPTSTTAAPTKQATQAEPGRPRTDALANLSGAQFDRGFAEQMIHDHEAAIARFEDAQKTAMNAELRAFIDATLPTMREHLSQAKDLHK